MKSLIRFGMQWSSRIAGLLAVASGVAVQQTSSSPETWQPQAAATPRIAIIIDDLGYKPRADTRAINLPWPVSVAVLPAAPRARSVAASASAGGKDVLLHLPMQARADDADQQGLRLDMSRDGVATTLDAALASVPEAIGVNNHRGSLLTEQVQSMQWLMLHLKQRGSLFFVDSYTSADSVALRTAREVGVPAVKRDVFLDHELTDAGIRREFERLKDIASTHGYAVAIGHPHRLTLDFLEAELPLLAEQGYQLVGISELLRPAGRTTARATTLNSF